LIIQIGWFLAAFLFATIFVCVNWSRCVDFTQVSGYNIVFLLFIVLILFPLVSALKLSALGAGIEMTSKSESANAIISKVAGEVSQEAAMENCSDMNAEDFKKTLEEVRREIFSDAVDFERKERGDQ
jgi:hypothetical protein